MLHRSDILGDMRVAIYPEASEVMTLRSAGSIRGAEPILEKREAMVLSRFTSLFISATVSGSTPMSGSSSIHAMSDDMGVPSWWAVSFESPTHTLFCSAFFVESTAK